MMNASEPAVSRRRHALALHDVAVVGGGMAGAAAALSLARLGLDVALVEAHRPKPWKAADDVDLRVVAMAPSSAACLTRAGIWEDVLAARAQVYRHMTVTDARNGARLAIDAADSGHDALGWIVENRLVQHVLWQKLEVSAVRLACPGRVTGVQQHPDRVHLDLEDGSGLDARMVVAADGASSPLRDMVGIRTRGHGYAQRAVVAHVHTRRGHGETAWQRFLPGGPIALLPLADGRCSIVWSMPEDEATRVLDLDDQSFCEAVSVASDLACGAVSDSSARASFPLQLKLARDYRAGRVVLLGDAAHAVHPLAGQGINLGLRDVTELRDVLADAQERGLDVGTASVLERYARRRRSADTLDALSFDAIARIYSWQRTPLTLLRGLGVRAVNRVGGIKRILTRHASGW